MKTLFDLFQKNKWLLLLNITAIFLYLTNQFYLKKVGLHSFFNSHMNDLLFAIVYLPPIYFLEAFIKKRQVECYCLRKSIFIGFLFGIFFEILMPLVQPEQVADPIDMVMYVVGSIIVFAVQYFQLYSIPKF